MPGYGQSSPWRPLVKGAAAIALTAAFAVPLLRKKRRIPPSVTTAAVAAGPPALAVLRPRTRGRDAGLYALQMWAFLHAQGPPYDDPEALRRRLRIDYPIRADRALGGGELPNVRLQRALAGLGAGATSSTAPSSWVHWAWFFEPHSSLAWILARAPRALPASARQMSAVYDLGCAVYAAVPTAPPWWASEEGHTDDEGPADHGRGRRGAVGARLAAPVRLPRRQPVGGDALASLRRLADGGDPADRDGAGRGGGGLGVRRRRSASRSSTSASTTWSTCSPAPRSSRGPPRRAATSSRWPRPSSRGLQRLERIANRVDGCDDSGSEERPKPAVRRELEDAPTRRSRAATSDAPDEIGDEAEPSFFADPKRLIQTGRRRPLVVAIYVLFPKIVGLEDALDKIDQGDPLWIGVASPSRRRVRRLRRALPRRRRREGDPPRVERELPDHDGGARRDAALLGRRRRRHPAHLLGAAQGGDGAAPGGLPDGRLPRPPLLGLPGRPGRLRGAAAYRGALRRRAALGDR